MAMLDEFSVKGQGAPTTFAQGVNAAAEDLMTVVSNRVASFFNGNIIF